MNQEALRLTKHGLAIIGYLIGFGFMFILAVNGIIPTFQNYPIETKILVANLVPIIPAVGLGILIYWVLWLAMSNPKCPHCGKNVLDLRTLGEEGKRT